MFTARFLQPDRNLINATPTHRSMLFAARAAMRCNAASESPSISPMTAALVFAADQRTTRPEVPSIFALVTAEVEATPEPPELTSPPADTREKREKKPKSETRDEALRKRSRRKSGGTRKRKTNRVPQSNS